LIAAEIGVGVSSVAASAPIITLRAPGGSAAVVAAVAAASTTSFIVALASGLTLIWKSLFVLRFAPLNRLLPALNFDRDKTCFSQLSTYI
jgi:hypothetical protein